MEGKRLGDKRSLEEQVHEITGIDVQALQGRRPLSEFTIDERMEWAANRKTKREEDAAYSLFGIFDVHMPLIYGEGVEKAFRRLQEEIKKYPSVDGSGVLPPEISTRGGRPRHHFRFGICSEVGTLTVR